MLVALTIFGALVINVATGLRYCDDCVAITRCSQAIKVADNRNQESANKLLAARYGFDKRVFQVCCSDFNEGDANHPYVKLLPDYCGSYEEDRIIHGSTVRLGEFPWIVLLGKMNKKKAVFHCGGSLITSRYVLTAAHCIHKHLNYFVRVGEYNTSSKVDCVESKIDGTYQCAPKYQNIAVTQAIVHPGYKRFPVPLNDIALLRLRKQVDLSVQTADTVCLPVFQNLRENDIANEMSVVAGWGMTERGKQSDVILKVNIPMKSEETCRQDFRRYYPKVEWGRYLRNTLCAGGEDGKDSCAGDSGSPLMIVQPYNDTYRYRYVQNGIVSYGNGCGTNSPSVYTDVRKFMTWILDNIKP